MTTTTEMHDTLPKNSDTPKCRASSSQICLTTASIAQEKENKSELPVIPSTCTTSFKPTSSGLEDFLSLRTGKLDSQTSSYHTHNITPGKGNCILTKKIIQSLHLYCFLLPKHNTFTFTISLEMRWT